MKLYHGTVKKFLEDILRDGLKPGCHQNEWRAILHDPLRSNGKDLADTLEEAVYLSPSIDFAKHMAEAKAKFFSVAPGKTFKAKRGAAVSMTKDEGVPVFVSSPVVLTVEIEPQELMDNAEGDPRSSFEEGIMYFQTIPANKIQVVWEGK